MAKKKTPEQIQGEINAYKQLLDNTDYKAHKFLDGAITEEEYESVKADRQNWRDEINKLQELLEG